MLPLAVFLFLVVAAFAWRLRAERLERKNNPDADVRVEQLPDIAPRLENSPEYDHGWIYPDEILPVNALEKNAPHEVFDAEMDARYEAAKRRHKNAIEDIALPVVTEHDPSIINSLTPAERLFLWYIADKPVKSPKIGIYWRLDYGLYDYRNCIIKLMKAGLLAVSVDPERYLSSLTADVLRKLCKGFQLPVSGRKRQLVDRPMAHDFAAETARCMAEDHALFALTESGARLVDENAGLIFYHQNKHLHSTSLTLDNVEKLLRAMPGVPPQDVLLAYRVAEIRR